MKRKKIRARKGRALHWAAILAGLLIVLTVTGIFVPLPYMTADLAALRMGLDRVHIVHGEWLTGNLRGERLYVSDNQDAVLINIASFHSVEGWYSSYLCPVLYKEEPDTYHRNLTSRRYDDEERWVCLAGFVPYGQSAPTLAYGYVGDPTELGKEEDFDGLAFREEPQTIKPTADIPVSGGHCYLAIFHYPALEDLSKELFQVAVVTDSGYERVTNWSMA